MGLYSRKQYEEDLERLERASQTISSGYVRELSDDEILGVLESLREVATPSNNPALGVALLHVSRARRVPGMAATVFDRGFEQAKRKLQGKLLFTRQILADGEKRGCGKKGHASGCKCRRLAKAKRLENGEIVDVKVDKQPMLELSAADMAELLRSVGYVEGGDK